MNLNEAPEFNSRCHRRAESTRLRAVWPIALVAAVCWCALAAQSHAASPNIVLILSDDAGYNDFGFMASLHGEPTDVETPNLDALASQSVVMSSAYAAGAVCSPSRAGLLTGQYQQRIGYEDNPGPNDGLEAGQQLVSHQLKNLGYTTGAIGKWHLGETDNVNRPLDMGFDEFFGFFGGGRPYWRVPNASASLQMRRGDTNVEALWHQEGNASRYDPINGRHATDAFGEEAVSFINRHADDETPFFLYVGLNAPHTPLQAKQEDLDRFADIADPSRRAIAALNYGLDRAVGDITSALAANGIDDNTIVVFMNDNGGTSVSPHNNFPLKGHKGSLWEGGIRVPMIVKAPGLTPGVYDAPITSLDLMSTFVAAAGGEPTQIDTDGIDLMPYLSSDISNDPHELMLWRGADGRFAVRRGEWKLVRPGTATFARLHNVVDDIDESAYVNQEHPELVTELLRDLTIWEATLEKPKWGAIGEPRNRFDHFVFRSDAAQRNWNEIDAWHQAGTTTNVTFLDEDAYANAVLEFSTRNDADYTATNNMRRSTNQTFMLNQIQFTGSFAGAAEHVGTINGETLLFVKSLTGEAPQIRLEATSTSTTGSFAFQLENELLLFDNLLIAGNGSQELHIAGNIRDYYEPRGLNKIGVSSVTLAGNNTFGGTFQVLGGHVTVDGPSASINGAESIFIGAAGTLTLDSGNISVESLDNSYGGTFNFHGGRLTVADVEGDLVNGGGTFAPGSSPAAVTINGDFVQNVGQIEIELGGTTAGSQFDRLVITGDAALNDTLDVKLVNGFAPSFGQEFEFLSAGGSIVGDFSEIRLPALAGGLPWGALVTNHSYSLLVGLPGDYNQDGNVDSADYTVWRDSMGATVAPGTGADGNVDGRIDQLDFDLWNGHFGAYALANLRGDYNQDGEVSAADYTLWRDTFGQLVTAGTGADGSRNGQIDNADYELWKVNFGTQTFGAGSAASTTVPEPSAWILALLGAFSLHAFGAMRRRRSAR